MISRETLFPKASSGGGVNIVDWNMQTSVVPQPPVLTEVPSGEIPIPTAPSTITPSTISNSSIGNAAPSYSLAKIADNCNFGGPKWMLGRVNSASGTFVAGMDFIGFGVMSFDTIPVGAFVGYSMVNQQLEIRDVTTQNLLASAPMNVNDWFAVYIDNTTNTIGAITQGGQNVSTVITSVPDISGFRIYAGGTLMVSSGTGAFEFAISIDTQNLGNIDVTGMTPIAVNVTVLPQGAVVGDVFRVTAGGTYKTATYATNDVILYVDNSPENLFKLPTNILTNSRTVRVPEDFANINMALNEARKFISVNKAQFIILISEGHTLTGADEVSILGEDLPNVYIQAEGTGCNVNLDGGYLFSIIQSSFGGFLGTFTDQSTVSNAFLSTSNVKFTTGLGTIGSSLVTNDFNIGETILSCQMPFCFIESNQKPANPNSNFGWSDNTVYVSTIKTDRELNLGANNTNTQTIYSTRTDGILSIKHQYNGSGAYNIYFDNTGSGAPDNFTLMIYGKTSGTVTNETFSIAFRETQNNVSVPHLAQVHVGYSTVIVDCSTSAHPMQWKSDGNPLVTMAYSNTKCIIKGIFPSQKHVASSTPNNLALMSPSCQLHMVSWNSAIRGTHYTSSFGKLISTSNFKKRLPAGISAYGSYINVHGVSVEPADNRLFISNITTLNITEEHLGKVLYINENIGNVNVVFDVTSNLVNNSGFEPGYVKIVKMGAANEITFTGPLNPVVLSTQYSTAVFELDFIATYGRWVGSYSHMPEPIV
ncbi:MAG: hypothetical protein WC967_09165 [Balneolaceae bacterium]